MPELKFKINNFKLKKILIFFAILGGVLFLTQNGWATTCINTLDYDCVACTEGETGVCRQPKDLSLAKIQATISASTPSDGTVFGDGVYLKAGTEEWTNYLNVNKKGLVLKGAGSAATHINCNYKTGGKECILLNGSKLNITGINWVDLQKNANLIEGGGENIIIHDNKFTDCGLRPIWFKGNGPAVIYNNLFDGKIGNVYVTGKDEVNYNNSLIPIDYSSADWIFLEGNTFLCEACNGLEGSETQGGGKLVERYNTWIESPGTNMQSIFDQHNVSTPAGSGYGAGGRAFQIYNNYYEYNATSGYKRQFYIRAGTGLLFNNLSYYAGGSASSPYVQLRNYRGAGGANHDDFKDGNDCANWSSNTGETNTEGVRLAKCCSTAYHPNGEGKYPQGEGYPCVGQPGMQNIYNGAHEPIFIWNERKTMNNIDFTVMNSSSVRVESTEQWSIQLNRDYCVNDSKPTSCGGHPLVFTETACPHSLTGLTGSCDSNKTGTIGYNVYILDTAAPAAPVGLRIN